MLRRHLLHVSRRYSNRRRRRRPAVALVKHRAQLQLPAERQHSTVFQQAAATPSLAAETLVFRRLRPTSCAPPAPAWITRHRLVTQ